ncbi:TIGR03086 family metal-binding protein [Iamia majanohamensis]|uniref:TIGR03086 family metal-binding protein n=1 Tax=Iamia majanohamensis TaxID=467976 RepID=A0AAE9Y9E5_9ACTN|nr:TIGR03086 family metal-binding protein [Iamia majanohamensis]WCO66963.1 TIGR03086 family metal-binding protein [Iamia majanohamensis]
MPADDIAARTRAVATALTRTVEAVPDDAWDRPAPCEGWVARDVVDHLVGWMPPFFLEGWGRPVPDGPSAQVDPAGAWLALRDALLAALDDPAADVARPTPMGEVTLAGAWETAGLPDLLVHTWDLARATGLDERLDPDEVARVAEGIDAVDPATDAAMRDSGHYGPRVEVPAGADPQTRVLAFMGRTP